MTRDIKSALSDKTIEQFRKFLSEYQFNLPGLSQTITIRLYENVKAGWVDFEQSHFMHTPVQGDPYMTSHSFGDDEAHALQLAIGTLTQYHDEAVRNGYEPNDSWLIPNKYL